MHSSTTRLLSNLPILVKDGERYFKYAKVDLLDGGQGLLIYDYQTREKISRHADGKTYTRVVGTHSKPSPTTTVPFSQVQREVVRSVPIPSDATVRGSTFRGDVSKALIFSSTVLSSNGTFAAEIVDGGQLKAVLTSWQHHPDYVSAQTYRPAGAGKAVILTVLNRRSTGF